MPANFDCYLAQGEEPSMQLMNAAATNLKMFGVVIIGLFALGAGIGLTFTVTTVLAEHDSDQAIVHACYAPWGKIMRYVNDPDDCARYESVVDLASGDALVDLLNRLECVTDNSDSDTVIFEGCNVHVRNGLGSTNTKDGTGNLIVGYNENTLGKNRDGSHNIVVGTDHGYSEYGGFVAGKRNQITGIYSSVSGGQDNTASGDYSSVSGGGANEASELWSNVNGGLLNTASGESSSVSGGEGNLASGQSSSVSGGWYNTASHLNSSIGGGQNLSTSAAYEFLPN